MTTAAQIRNAFEERDTDVADLRAIYERAEGRDLTPEEQRKEASLNASIQAHDDYIERGLADIESNEKAAEFMERINGFATDETRTSGAAAMFEQRSLDSGSGTGLVPDQIAPDVLGAIRARADVLALPRAYDTDTMALTVPNITVGVTASVVPEGDTIPAVDPTFGSPTIAVSKLAVRSICSAELWQTSNPSVREAIGADHIAGHARKLASLILTGNGTAEPQGVIGTPGVTDTAVGAAPDVDVFHDEIVALTSAGLDAENDLTVVMHPLAWSVLEATTTTDGAYVFAPSGPNGAIERRLFGARVVLDATLPIDGGTGNDTVAIVGAFDYSALVQRNRVEVKASEDARWETAEIDVRSITYAGFEVVDPAAFRTLSGIDLAAA